MGFVQQFWSHLDEAQKITFILSTTALFISFLALYKNHLQPIKVLIYPGDKLWLIVSGGSGKIYKFHLSCALVNKTIKVGTVQRLEATVKGPDEEYFFVWSLFFRILPGGVIRQKEVNAHSISVPPKDSVNYFIEFITHPIRTDCLWPAGRYEVKIYGWVNKKNRHRKRNLKTEFHFNITPQIIKRLQAIPSYSKPHHIPIEEWQNCNAKGFFHFITSYVKVFPFLQKHEHPPKNTPKSA